MKQYITLILLMCFLHSTAQIPSTEIAGDCYLMTYHSNSSIGNGIKIVTQIPFDQEHMPTININGYNYDAAATIGLQISWYGDGGGFYQTAASSTGGIVPSQIQLAEENGLVVIYLGMWGSHVRFTVSAFAQGMGENPSWFENWEVVDDVAWGNSITDVYLTNKFSNVEANVVSAAAMYPSYLSASSSYVGDASAYRLRLSGASSFLHGESFRATWGIFQQRLDVTHSSQPMIYLGRTLTTSGAVGNSGGGLLAAIAGNAGAWVIGNPGDVIFGKEGGGGGSFKFITNVDYKFYTSNVQRMSLTANGALLIGNIPNPEYAGNHLLAVNGSAVFTKVKVKNYGAGWPDYVFEKSYKLRPLSEVEDFIRKNKHLPDVPSASEVDKNGLDVGENQAVLLKKLEELTLYVIQQDKEMKALKQRIKVLEAKPSKK